MFSIIRRIQKIQHNKKIYLAIKIIEIILAVFLIFNYFTQSEYTHSTIAFALGWLLITNMSFFYGTWLEEVEQFNEDMLEAKIEQYAHQTNQAFENAFKEIDTFKQKIQHLEQLQKDSRISK